MLCSLLSEFSVPLGALGLLTCGRLRLFRLRGDRFVPTEVSVISYGHLILHHRARLPWGKTQTVSAPRRSAMGRKVLEEPTGVGLRICARMPVATSDSPRLHGKGIPLEIRSSDDRVWSTLPV